MWNFSFVNIWTSLILSFIRGFIFENNFWVKLFYKTTNIIIIYWSINNSLNYVILIVLEFPLTLKCILNSTINYMLSLPLIAWCPAGQRTLDIRDSLILNVPTVGVCGASDQLARQARISVYTCPKGKALGFSYSLRKVVIKQKHC